MCARAQAIVSTTGLALSGDGAQALSLTSTDNTATMKAVSTGANDARLQLDAVAKTAFNLMSKGDADLLQLDAEAVQVLAMTSAGSATLLGDLTLTGAASVRKSAMVRG